MGVGPMTVFVKAFSKFNFQSCLPKFNRTKMALAAGVLMVLTGAIRAQTLADLGAAAPTPGVNDISQFSAVGNQTAPDGLNYYTDDHIGWHNGGEPGQTFTTGTNAGGYILTSLSLKTAGLNSYSGIGTATPYDLHIFSMSGSRPPCCKLTPRAMSPSTTATGCNGAACPYPWRPIRLMPGPSVSLPTPAGKRWLSPAATPIGR